MPRVVKSEVVAEKMLQLLRRAGRRYIVNVAANETLYKIKLVRWSELLKVPTERVLAALQKGEEKGYWEIVSRYSGSKGRKVYIIRLRRVQ